MTLSGLVTEDSFCARSNTYARNDEINPDPLQIVGRMSERRLFIFLFRNKLNRYTSLFQIFVVDRLAGTLPRLDIAPIKPSI